MKLRFTLVTIFALTWSWLAICCWKHFQLLMSGHLVNIVEMITK